MGTKAIFSKILGRSQLQRYTYQVQRDVGEKSRYPQHQTKQWYGTLNISKKKFKDDPKPMD